MPAPTTAVAVAFGLTVIDDDVELVVHPGVNELVTVKMMFAVPGVVSDEPVTTPVDASTVATAVLLLLHTPVPYPAVAV